MLLHLAEQLEIPLRERNSLLVATGYAPVFQERPLGDPALRAARNIIDLVLAGHEPYPALAIDRRNDTGETRRFVRDDDFLKRDIPQVYRSASNEPGQADQCRRSARWSNWSMMARDVPKNINGNDEAVLKITTVRENPKSLRVHLCGQFTGEYVSAGENNVRRKYWRWKTGIGPIECDFCGPWSDDVSNVERDPETSPSKISHPMSCVGLSKKAAAAPRISNLLKGN
jgi:hypothetical protein